MDAVNGTEKNIKPFKDEDNVVVTKLPHHSKQSLCTSRPPYRQGKKLTAVKAYSVNDESSYLMLCCVPDIKLQDEITNLCQKCGKTEQIIHLPEYPSKQFETAYLVKYECIRNARWAKKILDNKNFFGGILHVCYAPELETIEETRLKLNDRKNSVNYLSSKYKDVNLRLPPKNIVSMDDETYSSGMERQKMYTGSKLKSTMNAVRNEPFLKHNKALNFKSIRKSSLQVTKVCDNFLKISSYDINMENNSLNIPVLCQDERLVTSNASHNQETKSFKSLIEIRKKLISNRIHSIGRQNLKMPKRPISVSQPLLGHLQNPVSQEKIRND